MRFFFSICLLFSFCCPSNNFVFHTFKIIEDSKYLDNPAIAFVKILDDQNILIQNGVGRVFVYNFRKNILNFIKNVRKSYVVNAALVKTNRVTDLVVKYEQNEDFYYYITNNVFSRSKKHTSALEDDDLKNLLDEHDELLISNNIFFLEEKSFTIDTLNLRNPSIPEDYQKTWLINALHETHNLLVLGHKGFVTIWEKAP